MLRAWACRLSQQAYRSLYTSVAEILNRASAVCNEAKRQRSKHRTQQIALNPGERAVLGQSRRRRRGEEYDQSMRSGGRSQLNQAQDNRLQEHVSGIRNQELRKQCAVGYTDFRI